MRFLISWDRDVIQMSKWLPPAFLWLLCAALWLAVASDRSGTGGIPAVTFVKDSSGVSSASSSADGVAASKTDTARPGKAASRKQCINVNTAAVDELDVLPGVGPVIAQRIVDYRNNFGPFTGVTDLRNVKGIGKVTAEKIRLRACF